MVDERCAISFGAMTRKPVVVRFCDARIPRVDNHTTPCDQRAGRSS
jgi:hypothetical protein